jgi:hypothetical protein
MLKDAKLPKRFLRKMKKKNHVSKPNSPIRREINPMTEDETASMFGSFPFEIGKTTYNNSIN